MKITDFFSLLGGLALFLYGMQMMSNGLEAAAGNKMKQILEKLTANRFLGVLVGAGITAVIQSSSATTVMVVGFVNSGMMTLRQAVWIIMGANIGTTITGQLIALDVSAIAPLLAFLGVALVVFVKKQKVHHYGLILAGLGILFVGMDMMSTSMMPLRDSEAFVALMTKFSNPVLGILAGTIFTANRNAKRTTIIHLMFNIIGTTIFTTICILTPLTNVIEGLTPGNPAAQIANMHTLFNVVTTLLLLPFGTYLAKLATKILPEKKDENAEVMHMEFIRPMETKRDTQIGLSAIAVTSIRKEVHRMMTMARENVDKSFQAVKEGSTALLEDVREREEYIDFLNKEISKYISKTLVNESNPRDSKYISALFKVCGNVERIGDHAMNICEYTKLIERQKISFSSEVKREIDEMRKICDQAIDYLAEIGQEPGQKEDIKAIVDIEQKIDDMTEDYRQKQLERMQKGTCSEEGCIIYSEMLTDFERIGDHILNIGQEMGRGKVSA